MSAGGPPEPTPQESLSFPATAIDPRTGYAYMDARDLYDPRLFQPSGKKWDLNQPIDPYEPIEEEFDTRSIYVGNLDYGATSNELQYHFSGCGNIVRITIMNDKLTRQPKGYAYVEFGDEESANNGLAMNDTMFLGRPIKVSRKRNNHMLLVSRNRARYRMMYSPLGVGMGVAPSPMSMGMMAPSANRRPRRPMANATYYHPYY